MAPAPTAPEPAPGTAAPPTDADWAAAVELAFEGLITADEAGRVTGWNAAAARIFRLPAAVALGEPLARFLDLTPAEGGPGPDDPGPGRRPRVVPARRADGEPFAAEVVVARGRGEAIAVAARDASERQGFVETVQEIVETLSTEKLQRSAILSATSDGMVLVDPGGVVLYANRRFADLLGLDPDGLEGQAVTEVAAAIRAQRPEPPRAFDEALAGAQPEVPALRCTLGGPTARALRLEARDVQPDGRGGALGRLVVVRDVTVEEQAQRAKEELIGNVSHELRTPLTSIRGFVDLVRGGRAGPLSARQRECLDIVAENVARLTHLVADLLEVDRVERAPLTLARIELGPLLAELEADEAPEAARKGLTLAVEVPPGLAARADRARLRQVLQNLVANAVKYTPQGRVVVRARAAASDRVALEVEDTGVGIRPADLPRVFERFFRADDPRVQEAGGTGLGLSIVKALVERMRGAVEVESEPGRGSRFRVVLPAGEQAAEAPGAPTAARRAQVAAPARVLVVDPDPFRHRLYQVALHPLRLQLAAATTAARAAEVAAAGPVDLLLLDLSSREEGAAALFAGLRADPRLARIPCVVVASAAELPAALRAGADGFLLAPVDLAALRAEVIRVLGLPPPARLEPAGRA